MDCRFSAACGLAIVLAVAMVASMPPRAAEPKPQPAAVPLAGPAQAARPALPRLKMRADAPRRSVECNVKSPAYEGRAPLRAVRRAAPSNAM